MNNDCPICIQGISPATAAIGGVLILIAGGILASLVWWAFVLRAPMPPSLPHIRAALARMAWGRPRTWTSLAVWAWIVCQEIGRHTLRMVRQVRGNAQQRAVADGDDETVPMSTKAGRR